MRYFYRFLSLDKRVRFFYNENMDTFVNIEPIGYIKTDFKEKFGIPRQGGRAKSLTAQIIFYPKYRSPQALRGIEGFSHLWLLFDFSLTRNQGWSPTVRPPRLGGNTRVGVFASRSPFRPNHIGLSCVKLVQILPTKEYGDTLIVSGADLLDNTPIFDVKPYLPHSDCVLDAVGGYADAVENHALQVVFPNKLLQQIPLEKQQGLIECLTDDPRPAYKDEPDRIYGMKFDCFEIKFQVQNDTLTVISVEK